MPSQQPSRDRGWQHCQLCQVAGIQGPLTGSHRPLQVNQADPEGHYPLQWGALNNRVAVISLLLESGAQPDLVDTTGQAGLHWAGVRGSLQAAETLLRAGADLRCPLSLRHCCLADGPVTICGAFASCTADQTWWWQV